MKLVLSLVFCLLGAEFCSGAGCPYRTSSCPKVTSNTCCPAASKCRTKVVRTVRTVRIVRFPAGKTESSGTLQNELIKLHEVQMRTLRSKSPKEIERLNVRAAGMVQRISDQYFPTAMLPGFDTMGDVAKSIEYARNMRFGKANSTPEELLRELHRRQLENCCSCRKKRR